MQKAIVDKATGIILRLTTDEVPSISKTEDVIELVDAIDLSEGPKKIDKGTIKTATKAEFDLVDPEIVASKKREQIKLIITDIADNGATLEKIQDYFKLLK